MQVPAWRAKPGAVGSRKGSKAAAVSDLKDRAAEQVQKSEEDEGSSITEEGRRPAARRTVTPSGLLATHYLHSP